MANTQLNVRIVVRNDNLSTWNTKNPVLLKGEIAWISDTGKIKFGDGATTFSALPYSGLSIDDIPVASSTKTGLMATTEFVKLAGIEPGAQVNTIEVIQVNGVATSVGAGKTVNILVPTKLSDLTNDTGFVSKSYADTELAKKVDKVNGKSLVADADITKLANISPNATKVEDSATNGNIKIDGTETNVYTHPDKHPASIITEDTTHRFITDAEKAAYSAKADTKADVGLGNVTNDAQVKRSEMGTANGVATLDNTGKVKLTEVPDLDASKITSGVISIDRLPQGALERLISVANQAARFALTSADVQLGDTVKQIDSGIMYYVKDITNLNNASGYETYSAGSASSVPWGGVTGKPNTFPPSTHVHNKADISDFPTSMPANGGNADTVGGFTVGVSVPANAKFTDTTYTDATSNASGLFSASEKNKLGAISAEATKTEDSATNGNIKINGVEKNIYTLPVEVVKSTDTLILDGGKA